METPTMRVDDFDFNLPEDLIALRPAKPRTASRLLHVGEVLADRSFEAVLELFQSGDVLVLNNTKVIPAALMGSRASREEMGEPVHVELNLHKALPTEDGSVEWLAFARPARRLKQGDIVSFTERLKAEVLGRDGAEVTLRFLVDDKDQFPALLEEAGNVPLPPYIGRKRELDEQDLEDYQTVFAKNEGSVAAPTAGLHFTPDLLDALKAKGVQILEVTLHVGAGTFLPVSVDDVADHKMHAEWGHVSQEIAEKINAAKKANGNVICVGTTSLRLLESAAADDGTLKPFMAETDIFITPGYKFKIVDRLLTNFHLPKSTLFMLVSAFAGQARMKQAYGHAIENKYRFYSYGDACYLEKHDGL